MVKGEEFFDNICEKVAENYESHPNSIWSFSEGITSAGTPCVDAVSKFRDEIGLDEKPFVFDFLTPQFCSEVAEECRHLRSLSHVPLIPSSPHVSTGFILNTFQKLAEAPGLFTLQRLVADHLSPLVSAFYPTIFPNGVDLNEWLAFSVHYGPGFPEEKIENHIDESVCTVNVCLVNNSSGGEMVFPATSQTIPQVSGQAVMFLGDAQHSTLPSNDGERINLVFYLLPNHAEHRTNPLMKNYMYYVAHMATNLIESGDVAPTKCVSFDVPMLPKCCRVARKGVTGPSNLQNQQLQSTKPQSTSGSLLAGAPIPALVSILSHLSSSDIATLHLICHSWTADLNNPGLWSALYECAHGKTIRGDFAKAAYTSRLARSVPSRQPSATPRALLPIHLGAAGCRVAKLTWDFIRAEMGIQLDGQCGTPEEFNIHSFFDETSAGHFMPRALLVDPSGGFLSNTGTPLTPWFSPRSVVGPFADYDKKRKATYFTEFGNTDIAEEIFDAIRMEAERTGASGFILNSVIGGAHGSGLLSLLTTYLSDNFSSRPKIGFFTHGDSTYTSFHSARLSASCLPYNSLLSLSSGIAPLDFSFNCSNGALVKMLQTHLGIEKPTIDEVNHLSAQMLAVLTSSLRTESALNCEITEFSTNFVPFPTVSMCCGSYAPLGNPSASVAEISNSCFEPSYATMPVDYRHHKHMAMALMYRGDVVPKDVMAAVASIKTKRTIQFVDWAPTGFKCGIGYFPVHTIPTSPIPFAPRSLLMISNTTAMSEHLSSVVGKVDKMRARKAFLHNYEYDVTEMLDDARDNVASIISDYEEIMNPHDYGL